MRRWYLIPAGLVVLALAAGAAFAAPGSQATTKLVPHVVPITELVGMDLGCDGVQSFECEQGQQNFTTHAPTSTPEVRYFYIYIVATDYDPTYGLAGVQFGLDYDGATDTGVDVIDWTSCTTAQFAMDGWPGPGTGIRSIWAYNAACQTRGWSVVGFFVVTAYSSDVFRITPWPADGTLRVTDCSPAESELPAANAGAAGFGTLPGTDPCFLAGDPNLKVVPVRETTWGKIKSRYLD